MNADFEKILGQFKAQYGDKEGVKMFNAWVGKRSLDTGKPYGSPQCKKGAKESKSCKGICRSCACFKESFQWAKPLIKLLKDDASGKTYKVEAHFAVTSMNNNIYTGEEIAQAISTLPGKRVDLNHNLEWAYKGVDMLAAAFENGCAEVLLHVDNGAKDAKDRDVQETIDSGVVDCVSIEADSKDAEVSDEGIKPVGMRYEGMALLDQDALPGIPLTRIRSLEMVMESIFNEVSTLEKQQGVEVKEKMADKKFSEMNIDDLKNKIVDLTSELAALDKKMWPEPKVAEQPSQPSDADRVKLRAQQVLLQTELQACQQALADAFEDQLTTAEEKLQQTQVLKKPVPKEGDGMKANYCPMCGAELDENDACPTKDCAAFGAQMQLTPEKLAELTKKIEGLQGELGLKVAESKELGANVVSLSTENLRLKSKKVPSVDAEVSALSGQVADLKRENARLAPFESQVALLSEKLEKSTKNESDARGKNVSYTSEISKLEGKCGEYTGHIATLEGELSKAHEAQSKAEKLVETKEAEKGALRADWEDMKRRKEVAEQRLQNKLEECTRLQTENADLLLYKSESVNKGADLAGKFEAAVKSKVAAETENTTLREELGKRDKIVSDQSKAIEKALQENKRVYKILKEAGMVLVDGSGNLVSSS
jgi:hypothetical protein